MNPTPVSTIAHFIQLSLGPVFLLAGIGSILNVMANRLSRVVDRVRRLEGEFADASRDERHRAVAELKTLGKRITLINWAITACTASALFVCLVVAIMFVGALTSLHMGRPIALLFIATMTLLIGGLILFLLEIRTAARSLRIRHDLLEPGRG